MNLLKMIGAEMSRKNTDFVKNIVLDNPECVEDVFKLIILNEEPVSRRAIWVLDLVSEQKPELVFPYIEPLIDNICRCSHAGLKRHTLRILSRYSIPENKAVEALDWFYKFLNSEKESVAVRYYALENLYQMSEEMTALKRELQASLELLSEEKSRGLSNHLSKMKKQLKKEIS